MSVYRLQDSDKGIIGPVGLGTVRSLAESGALSQDLMVSRDGGPFLPVRAFEELSSSVTEHLVAGGRPTYTGDVGVLSFFKVFHRLYVSSSTGQLLVRDGVLRKEVFLETGQPVFVVSNVMRERLGEFLVARHKIDREELAVALRLVDSSGTPLGETLVERGRLTREELQRELREQQITRLVDLCAWEAGHYSFHEKRQFSGKKMALGPLTGELVTRAARLVSEKAVLLRVGPHLHQLARRRKSVLAEQCEPHLTEAERRLLASIDGERTVVEHITSGGEGNDRRAALTVIYLLWEIEALDFQSRRGP